MSRGSFERTSTRRTSYRVAFIRTESRRSFRIVFSTRLSAGLFETNAADTRSLSRPSIASTRRASSSLKRAIASASVSWWSVAEAVGLAAGRAGSAPSPLGLVSRIPAPRAMTNVSRTPKTRSGAKAPSRLPWLLIRAIVATRPDPGNRDSRDPTRATQKDANTSSDRQSTLLGLKLLGPPAGNRPTAFRSLLALPAKGTEGCVAPSGLTTGRAAGRS